MCTLTDAFHGSGITLRLCRVVPRSAISQEDAGMFLKHKFQFKEKERLLAEGFIAYFRASQTTYSGERAK